MINIETIGNFNNITKFFNKSKHIFSNDYKIEKYADAMIEQLSNFTPKDTSKTSKKWYYNIRKKKDITYIDIYNSNVNNGVNVAIIIQYGHATKDGKWINGIDYINPAIESVYGDIIKEIEYNLK